MYDLYYWPTPNGHKIAIFLEEVGAPYQIIPIDIRRGDQFDPDFLRIAPNNKMPALMDLYPNDGDGPLALFESGAILEYLAEKHDLFFGNSMREKNIVRQWLMWQVAGLGPMAGQNVHFNHYATEDVPYGKERYLRETSRLYAVLNKQLKNKSFVADTYSIADMAIYPWIVSHERQGINLSDFPNIQHWFELMGQREAVKRAYARAEECGTDTGVTEESKAILFGQDASAVS